MKTFISILLFLMQSLSLKLSAGNTEQYIHNTDKYSFYYNPDDNENFKIVIDNLELPTTKNYYYLHTTVLMCDVNTNKVSYMYDVIFQTKNNVILGNNMEYTQNSNYNAELHRKILNFLIYNKGYITIIFYDKNNNETVINIPTLH